MILTPEESNKKAKPYKYKALDDKITERIINTWASLSKRHLLEQIQETLELEKIPLCAEALFQILENVKQGKGRRQYDKTAEQMDNIINQYRFKK